ncbi:MAG: 3-hydroxyacyl-CoA dehydrogenase NAD-binding domain-containing protein [Candidatus Nanopelagicaceae bacterium]
MSADVVYADEVVTNAYIREVDLTAFGVSGKLALITIDNGMDHTRPTTLGPQSMRNIGAAIDQALAANPAAIAITGKPFILAAGADLSGITALTNTEQAKQIISFGHNAYAKLRTSKIPTFCFINGLALGGGTELALSCQYRTVASTAYIALPEVFIGLVPGWSGVTILPKMIGPTNAVKVILQNSLNNNTMLKAKEALELGMADELYQPVDFLEKSVQFVADVLNGKKKIERKDHSNDSDWDSALALGRAAINKKYNGAKVKNAEYALELIKESKTNTIEQGLAREVEVMVDLMMGDEFRASIYAFNLIQKGRKKVAGAPKANLARKVSKVGVVGAGLMASQLALLLVRNLKCPVVISDLDQARVDKGVAYIKAELTKLVEKKRMTAESANRLAALIIGTTNKADYAGCDFIIEAVFEELQLKNDLFKELEKHISPECVLATNTSSLSVEKMSAGLQHPNRVVGFHFFNPVAVMPLLEIARTPATDDESTATAISVGKDLKKTMVIAKDAPGFIVNRLLTRFMGEITDAMDEGTPYDVADNALREIGFPMTPFELFDLVGPGVALHVSETLHNNLGPRYRVSPTIKRLVEKGVRTIYIKDDKGNKVPNPEALALMEKGSNPSTSEQVRDRALKALAEEARMMLDEGVVSSPQEIDLSMLLGAGWPLMLGGILPYLDRAGFANPRFHEPGVASLPQ